MVPTCHSGYAPIQPAVGLAEPLLPGRAVIGPCASPHFHGTHCASVALQHGGKQTQSITLQTLVGWCARGPSSKYLLLAQQPVNGGWGAVVDCCQAQVAKQIATTQVEFTTAQVTKGQVQALTDASRIPRVAPAPCVPQAKCRT